MPHRPYRIADVTVVDPRTGSHTAHQDVRITDGRIGSVTATVDRDPGLDTVPGRGRFVVPGYTDMHAHPLARSDPGGPLALMLAHGITGFRQMGGSPGLLARRRTGRLDLGDRAPRLLATPGSLLTPLNAGTAAAAVTEARRQADQGADFLKAGMITPDVYFAVQQEATRLGLPVLGHLPAGIDVRAAATAGFRSVEHVGPGLGVLAGCSCDETDLLARSGSARTIPRPPVSLSSIPFLDTIFVRLMRRALLNPIRMTTPAELDTLRRALHTFDEQRAHELAAHFAVQGTWHCPTLIRIKAQELCDAPAFAEDPDLRYVPTRERRSWYRTAEGFTAQFDATQRELFAAQYDLQLRLVAIFAAEGVPILSGTDTGGAVWVVPGASLHDELDLLAAAGLGPLRVLQTTTSDPARFLGREDVAGSVDAGKDADLVLLDADPTVSVANLHTVSGVVARGIHHPDTELAAITEAAAAAART